MMETPSTSPDPISPDGSPLRQRQVVQRIGRDLHSVTEFLDGKGRVVQRLVAPIMVDFRWQDVLQIVVGACVLCIPMTYAEEVWVLGQELSTRNAILVSLFSITFVSLFVYLSFYRRQMRANVGKFLARILATYVITIAVAAMLLFFVDKLPLVADTATAIKRVILVAFPGCFSATVVDALK